MDRFHSWEGGDDDEADEDNGWSDTRKKFRRTWETNDDDDDDEGAATQQSGGADLPEDGLSPEEEAGIIFVEILVWLVGRGKRISAKWVCVLCWYAARAGQKGPAGEFGFRPDAPTGHYQRHLDTVLYNAQMQKLLQSDDTDAWEI
jgi:hypothetical protein